eukprot:4605678-Pyramimonas_sp.AAC.1
MGPLLLLGALLGVLLRDSWAVVGAPGGCLGSIFGVLERQFEESGPSWTLGDLLGLSGGVSGLSGAASGGPQRLPGALWDRLGGPLDSRVLLWSCLGGLVELSLAVLGRSCGLQGPSSTRDTEDV